MKTRRILWKKGKVIDIETERIESGEETDQISATKEKKTPDFQKENFILRPHFIIIQKITTTPMCIYIL